MLTSDLICYVVNYDDAVSSSVVTGSDGAESLLTGRVPLVKQSRARHTHTQPPCGAADQFRTR